MALKIAPAHYQELKNAIATVPADKIQAHKKAVFESGKFKDFGMRIRWDILHATKPSAWVCDTLYPYLNDSHIDSALKAACAELGIDLTVPA